jgi:hypothetical protein
MLNQIPSVFPSIYYDSIDYPLWIIVIIIGIINSIVFLLRTKKATTEIQKSIFGAMSGLMFFMAIMRICYTIASRFLIDQYDFWTTLGYITGIIGMAWFIFVYEKNLIKKTKFLLTIFSLSAIIVGTLSLFEIITRDYPRIYTSAAGTIDILVVIIMYSWLVKITTGSLRNQTIISLIGILLTFGGFFIDSEIVFGLFISLSVDVNTIFIVTLAPALQSIGMIIIVFSQKQSKQT